MFNGEKKWLTGAEPDVCGTRPEPWLTPEMLERWTAEPGLGALAAEDRTAATLPSCRTIAPHRAGSVLAGCTAAAGSPAGCSLSLGADFASGRGRHRQNTP